MTWSNVKNILNELNFDVFLEDKRIENISTCDNERRKQEY